MIPKIVRIAGFDNMTLEALAIVFALWIWPHLVTLGAPRNLLFFLISAPILMILYESIKLRHPLNGE